MFDFILCHLLIVTSIFYIYVFNIAIFLHLIYGQILTYIKFKSFYRLIDEHWMLEKMFQDFQAEVIF